MFADKYKLVLCDGVAGPCIYLNDYRIAGPKPWGGGTTVKSWTVALDDLRSAVPALKAAVTLVNEQANDDGLWFVPQTATEAYLQQALRRLHEAVEGMTAAECARNALNKASTGA